MIAQPRVTKLVDVGADFPAVTVAARSMPWASTMTWCLLPVLPRSTGEGSVASPPFRARRCEPSTAARDRSKASPARSSASEVLRRGGVVLAGGNGTVHTVGHSVPAECLPHSRPAPAGPIPLPAGPGAGLATGRAARSSGDPPSRSHGGQRPPGPRPALSRLPAGWGTACSRCSVRPARPRQDRRPARRRWRFRLPVHCSTVALRQTRKICTS